MCWSGEASLVLATCGYVGGMLSLRHNPISRAIPIFYFGTMELLQAITYTVIGQCGSDLNYLLTVLSYIHIAFQPFFINMFTMTFLPDDVWKKNRWVWLTCAATAVIMLSMLAFPSFPAACIPADQTICGLNTCSVHGPWHISWVLKLSNLDSHYISYILAAFIVPFIYGGWRVTLYHLLCGPMLMFILSSDKDERPAVWCLLSIGLLLATHIPFLNKLLTKK